MFTYYGCDQKQKFENKTKINEFKTTMKYVSTIIPLIYNSYVTNKLNITTF